jgi:hypothetical protein
MSTRTQIKPRVNSSAKSSAIADEAAAAVAAADAVAAASASDRERLELRLDQYDLVERDVRGDGACQVRGAVWGGTPCGVGDGLLQSPSHSATLYSSVGVSA